MTKGSRSKYLLIAVMSTVLSLSSAWVEAAPPGAQNLPAADNPAVELNRNRKIAERVRVERQIKEDQARREEQKNNKQSQPQAEESDVKFLLKKVDLDTSVILSKEELGQITDFYIGKEITLKDLYTMVQAINDLYAKKGYLTCSASLGPQTIKNGLVHVDLLEGRTGNVTVEGNKSTRKGYITKRLSLKEGRVDNFRELNSDILYFNGTNDVQLRIQMKAGEESGTTDYDIIALEPRQHNFSLYGDNAGSTSTGEWRYGLFYINRSLTGVRDSLTLGTLNAESMHSFSGGYGRQLGRSGTRLDVNYNTNSLEVSDGSLENLKVKGHAYAWSAKLTQPLMITNRTRLETSLEYGHQNSETDYLSIHWMDDTLRDLTWSLAVTNYWNSAVLYHQYGYCYGQYDNIRDQHDKYGRMLFNGLYQKAYKHGQTISLRYDGQYTNNNNLPSGRQFYIGGAYSVRGYKESVVGADKGFYINAEYGVPVFKGATVFGFLDYGGVYGDNAFDDHILSSYGLGIKSNLGKNVYLSLTWGRPLRREINYTEVSANRLHLVMNCQF